MRPPTPPAAAPMPAPFLPPDTAPTAAPARALPVACRARPSVLLLVALRGHRLRLARAPRGAECAGQQRADYDDGFHDHDRLAAEALFDAIAKCSTSRAPRPTASATSSRTAC